MPAHPFDIYPQKSTNPYGLELAEAVAARLDQGPDLHYFHRDYCGYGLGKLEGEYVYDEVYDGYILEAKDNSANRVAFTERAEFVSWLANQSDESLSGRNPLNGAYNNQCIDYWRLKAFIEGKD
jgi:hypothetical protein